MDIQGGARRAHRIVIVRAGRTEKRHHGVADVLVDRTAIADDNAVDERGVTAHQLTDLFRIERLRHRGEPAEIGEENGDLPALACRLAIGMSHARLAAVTPRSAIAASNRLRWPSEMKPSSFRSASVSLTRTAKSMSFSANAGAYWPSPNPFSHSSTSMADA